MLRTIRVADYMHKGILAVHADTDIGHVVDFLLEHHLSGCPVIDQQNHLLGFISEQDCIKSLISSSYYGDDSEPASSLMSTEILSVGPDDSIFDLAQRMQSDKPKNYPVVEAGKLLGMITRHDVLHAIAQTTFKAK